MESKHPDGGNAKTRSIGGYTFTLNAGTRYIAIETDEDPGTRYIDYIETDEDPGHSIGIFTAKKIWEPGPETPEGRPLNPPRRRLVARAEGLTWIEANHLVEAFNTAPDGSESVRIW